MVEVSGEGLGVTAGALVTGAAGSSLFAITGAITGATAASTGTAAFAGGDAAEGEEELVEATGAAAVAI
jgi:hypothetical protein